MAQMIQAVRGMNDILPPETSLWQYAEFLIRRTFQSHGFQEIRFPLVEKTELFKRSIGEVTDIVEKEMYTFLDRKEESLTLRPEGTASAVRAVLEHGLIHNQIQRLWYTGPYFRYEKPQKGRYRQFHQCAAEVFGLEGPDIDAALILMSAEMLDKLRIKDFCTLQLNTLGTQESRKIYRQHLVKYFEKHKATLDSDSLKRLDRNPLRILDSKNPQMKELIHHAPKLLDYLDEESQKHFQTLKDYLKETGLTFEINPQLVRGLDYYNKTVFEWVTNKLGAQSTVCAGGRYDSLVQQLGGRPTPALGFAAGMERIILIMQQENPHYNDENALHAYLVTDSKDAYVAGLKLANYLRNKCHRLRVLVHSGGGNLKNQFKKADKSGAQYAIIIGEHELKTNSVSLKNLREDLKQQTLYQDELAEYFEIKIQKPKK